MGHRNISISDEIYYALASLKFPGESFNSLFARMVKHEKPKGIDWNTYYGAWGDITDKEMNEINKELKSFWKTWKLP